jgi:hypothetical protein
MTIMNVLLTIPFPRTWGKLCSLHVKGIFFGLGGNYHIFDDFALNYTLNGSGHFSKSMFLVLALYVVGGRFSSFSSPRLLLPS